MRYGKVTHRNASVSYTHLRQALEDDAYILVISDGTRTSDMVVCE